MSKTEVSLRLGFFLLRGPFVGSDVSIALDRAEADRRAPQFSIQQFMKLNECECV